MNATFGDDTLLSVRGLTKTFAVGTGKNSRRFTAVDRVGFDLRRGESLGIVGESGSGKTTAVRCILRAVRPTQGAARLYTSRPGNAGLNGEGRGTGEVIDLVPLRDRDLKPIRRRMQMIFQDPFSSLNPRMTVGDIVAEPLAIHRMGNRRERRQRVANMLDRVGLSAEHMNRYPHAFSGGQRQRIGIARALAIEPELVVADEAVSALDVSVQARVLDLLKQLQHEMGLTYIFVSHDLSVVRQFCDRVAVMHRGRIVEIGDAEAVFNRPRHAYTRVLLSAIPYPDPDRKVQPLRVEDLTPDELEPLPDAMLEDRLSTADHAPPGTTAF